MNPIVAVQELSITMLEFSLRLAHHHDLSWNTICDEYTVLYNKGSLSIEFSAEGIALLDIKAAPPRREGLDPMVLVTDDHFGGINTEFPPSYFLDIFDALDTCGIKRASFDVKLKRYSKRRGAMEVRFESFGSVYLEYALGKKNAITVTRCGAVDNPEVRLRTII